MDDQLAAVIWRRLVTGRSLDDLALPLIEGRIDLRGLHAPDPSVARRYSVERFDVTELFHLLEARNVGWRGLDFSGCRLPSLRFFDSTIENCRFDGAHCRDWRMWGTTIEETSFRKTDLRDTALGGIDRGRRNAFRRVDFANADLRQSVHGSADMIACNFDHTRLDKVDFQGTVFVDCVFAGELNEVQFFRHKFRGEALPPNEMKGVDLRRADLYYCEFRKLDMDDVRWPEDDAHILVKEYKATLDLLLERLEGRQDKTSRSLRAMLEFRQKWAGENQQEGVFNKRELIEWGGEELVAEFLALIPAIH
jgi:uncharacterized protein YjbI with pentapeptide repeats